MPAHAGICPSPVAIFVQARTFIKTKKSASAITFGIVSFANNGVALFLALAKWLQAIRRFIQFAERDSIVLDNQEDRVAVLVDCDNTSPEILEYALRVVAQFGRVVVRRGYGNHATLANKWQEALVRLAFTPCLQYQYASGKNTSDIALALDALEDLFDHRAETYCLVTSDSDFAYLCRKLRERGSMVYIVGEKKTPDALRNASDQFFEYQPPESESIKAQPSKVKKQRPKALVDAVSLLAADASEDWVGLPVLGQYMRRTNPGFSPQQFGYSGLLEMIRTYPELVTRKDGGSHWVQLKEKAEREE